MSKQIENLEAQINWHWRDSMRPARFFMLDARAVLPFMLLLVYFRPITLIVTVIITTVFFVMEKKGLTLPSALRTWRLSFVGRSRPGWIGVHKKGFIDYG